MKLTLSQYLGVVVSASARSILIEPNSRQGLVNIRFADADGEFVGPLLTASVADLQEIARLAETITGTTP